MKESNLFARWILPKIHKVLKLLKIQRLSHIKAIENEYVFVSLIGIETCVKYKLSKIIFDNGNAPAIPSIYQ